MYPPPELVAQAGPFGCADLVQQRGTVAELAQICQTWGATLADLHHRSAWLVGTTRGTVVGDQSRAPASIDEATIDEARLDEDRATRLGASGRATGLRVILRAAGRGP